MDASEFIEEITHAAKDDDGEVAVGFPKLAPSSAKRRRPSGGAEHPEQPTPRPKWGPAKNSHARKDLSAFEKRAICKAHDSRGVMLKNTESPLLRESDFFRESPIGPIRKIASQLCRVGQISVSICFEAAPRSGGAIRSSAPGAGKKQDLMGVKMKDVAPEDGSLGDVSQRRIADIRMSGRANTRANLLKYITEGPAWPGSPGACRRVFRRKLAQMGFIQSRNRELTPADLSKPRIGHWGTSYCIRRAQRIR